MMIFVFLFALVLGTAVGYAAGRTWTLESANERMLEEIRRVRSEGHAPGSIVRVMP